MNSNLKNVKDTSIGLKYNKINTLISGYKRLLLKEFNKNKDIIRSITYDLQPKK